VATPHTARRPAPPQPTARPLAGDSSAGLAVFAGIVMLVIGAFQVVIGSSTAFASDFNFAVDGYALVIPAAVWGWIHLGLGALITAAGIGVLSGARWASFVGVALAAAGALANFVFVPYYPLWSLSTIALDMVAIWALTAAIRRPRPGR